MKIALAQIESVAGDIEANVKTHAAWVKKAVKDKCQAIFFPELSITGYEPQMAKRLGLQTFDERLHLFQLLSDNHNITIGIGAPTISGNGRLISMIIFQPNQERVSYSKQILHKDEEPYFIRGNNQITIDLNGIRVAPAICYESVQLRHFEQALTERFDVYLASVVKPVKAFTTALDHYASVARKYQKCVLVVNSVGKADDFVSCGMSSIITRNGEVKNKLSDHEVGLLIHEIDVY